MMVSSEYGGNIHETVTALNEQGTSKFVHSFIPVSPSSTVVVFEFEFYPRYQQFCERVGAKPVSHKEFFGAGDAK
jgi:hypothetical protein